MMVRLARRMEDLRASDIREMLKFTQAPEVISFAGGLPAPECFPVEELKEASIRLLQQAGRQAMQYSTTEGHLPLRRWIAARMRQRDGVDVKPDQILVTSGSQQGLDLSGKLFLDEGDVVFCESPTYLAAISALQAFRPCFVAVPTDDDGMVIEELEQRLRGNPRAKLIYVIPDFQNPTGRTWSFERRRRLVELVRRFRVPVVEDCPYVELRYEGEPIPSLMSLDRDGLVVALGTFSKIFCPGMRIGWLAAAPHLFEKYVILKQSADLHTSTVSQMQIATYLETCDIDANITRIREIYHRRRDVMVAALERELPAGVRFTRPKGGMFLWVELPRHLSARDLLVTCIERQVVFVPGGSFFPNGGGEHTFRLNFSNMPEERIVEGIQRLAVAIREFLARRPAFEPRAAAAG